MAGVLAAIALVGIVAGIVGMFRPVRVFGISSRTRAAMFLLGGFAIAAAGSIGFPAEPDATASVDSSLASATAEPVTSTGGVSEAKVHASKVTAVLDQTTVGALVEQMPGRPEIDRDGSNRTYTWTFGDKSQIIATFRPRGGEGSGEGLVLYMVDVRPE